MKTILYTWFAVLLFGMAAVSCGDDDTKNNDTTGITGSSWKASETVGADRTTKKYTFKASANWVAQSDKPEWCKILTSSGDKGSDRQLNITVEANETGSTRSANITVQVSGYARAAQFAITQLGSSSGGTGADTELNKQVDKILEYYYLWNGEYRQMSRDLSLDYISSSDNFLKRTLLEMTTNDLDKKRQSNGSYSVYSYLLRTPLTKAVDGTKPEVNHGVAKKKEYGFGIAGLMGVRFVDGNNQPTGEYGLVVTSVYPDSPASEAGFRRGTFFAQYNGAAITAAKKFFDEFYYGDYYGVDLRNYALNMTRLYVLVTGNTASSSEAVINTLRGLDGFTVKLIGEKTNGKNVGMEVSKFTVGNYSYELAPISFQGYNAKQVTVDKNGLAVDTACEEWDGELKDYGDRSEPMLAAALSQITGQRSASVSGTRSTAPGVRPATDIALPDLSNRPNGMIVFLPAAEE